MKIVETISGQWTYSDLFFEKYVKWIFFNDNFNLLQNKNARFALSIHHGPSATNMFLVIFSIYGIYEHSFCVCMKHSRIRYEPLFTPLTIHLKTWIAWQVACQKGWFSDQDSEELINLAKKVITEISMV